jgi:hypothetical protein
LYVSSKKSWREARFAFRFENARNNSSKLYREEEEEGGEFVPETTEYGNDNQQFDSFSFTF